MSQGFSSLRGFCVLLSSILLLAGFAFASKEKIVLSFNATDGMTPLSGFVADKKGNLYGVTSIGGNGDCPDYGGQGCGTVFELTPPAQEGGAWTETVLYNFQGGADGDELVGGLILDESGNLYGVTELGGGGSCTYGCGTVFELSPPAVKGDAWTKSTLYIFQGGTKDGSYPEGTLLFDRLGNLYGTTFYGGSLNCAGYGCGSVFELSPQSGGKWRETVLHIFEGNDNGDASNPGFNLFLDAAGNLYGAAGFGGANSEGAVFELSPPAKQGEAWTESVIYSFIGAPDGSSPSGNLTSGANGVFYGVTSGWGPAGYGTVYELAPPAESVGQWTVTVLFSFDLGADGGNPSGMLALGEKGDLFGTTAVGGDYSCASLFDDGCGIAYKLTPGTTGGFWKQTILHSFTGGDDGIQPESGLFLGKFGLLYGTAELGGSSGAGVVFSAGNP